jgi:anti-sigma factor RsiW
MICDPRRLSYYRDGALSYDERYELEAHMRDCAECAASLRSLMRLAQVVRTLPMEPVSPTLRVDIQRLIVERKLEKQRARRPLAGFGRAVAPAAVAAAIALSSVVMFRTDPVEAPVGVAPAAALSDAPVTKPAVAAAPVPQQPAVASSQGAGNSAGTYASKPPAHVPVMDAGSGSLPTKFVNPALVPVPIARLYTNNSQVRSLLGESFPGSRTVTLLEQSFQGGLAIWRSDTRQIYVLQREDQTWSVHADTWQAGERIAADPTPPPPGAMVPAGGFGTVWRSTPEIKSRLGWAVYEPRGSGGSIQMFEHGLIVWTPHGLLYVLSDDGRWRTFPDASPI